MGNCFEAFSPHANCSQEVPVLSRVEGNLQKGLNVLVCSHGLWIPGTVEKTFSDGTVTVALDGDRQPITTSADEVFYEEFQPQVYFCLQDGRPHYSKLLDASKELPFLTASVAGMGLLLRGQQVTVSHQLGVIVALLNCGQVEVEFGDFTRSCFQRDMVVPFDVVDQQQEDSGDNAGNAMLAFMHGGMATDAVLEERVLRVHSVARPPSLATTLQTLMAIQV